MGQHEVVQLLKKSKRPLSVREMSDILGIGISSITTNCKRLLESPLSDSYKSPIKRTWMPFKVDGKVVGKFMYEINEEVIK